MQAVILAAGRGSRLGARTDEIPKGMVTLQDRPFLEWQHAALRAAGIDDITVITGYLGDVIAEHGFASLKNEQWNQGNMVSSLACALENLSGPLLISYSDIVYGADCVRKLLACTAPLALTYDPNWLELWSKRFDDPLSDAETFRLSNDGLVTEIGGRTASIGDIQGQFMGLIKLESEGRSWVEEVLRADPTARCSLDTTGLVQRLIKQGRTVTGVPIDSHWCEIDSLDDLAVAEGLIADGRLRFPGDEREDV